MSRKQRRKQKTNRNRFLIIAILGLITVGLFVWQEWGAGQGFFNPQEPESSETTVSESTPTQSQSSNIQESEQPSLADQLIETPDVSSSDWNLILVNRHNQLDADVPFTHYTTEGGFIIDARIAEAFEAMMADGRAAGMEFVLVSTYRTLAQQQANYDSVYDSYISQGYGHEEAVEKTEDYIALPNASEHSTGLAFDVTEPGLYPNGEQGLVAAFDQTPEAQWLYENAADYGFILRYPKGKEDITVIEYESWHFRYVGVENAKYIDENNLALEEYIDILQHNEAIKQQLEQEDD